MPRIEGGAELIDLLEVDDVGGLRRGERELSRISVRRTAARNATEGVPYNNPS